MKKTQLHLLPPLAPAMPRSTVISDDRDDAFIPAPQPGELLHFDLRVSFPSLARDPFGRDAIDHLAGFLRARGYVVTPPRLAIAARDIPTQEAIKRRAANMTRADELRERSQQSRGE